MATRVLHASISLPNIKRSCSHHPWRKPTADTVTIPGEDAPRDHKESDRPTFGGKYFAEAHGKPLYDLEQTLWDMFSRTAAAYPGREALVSLWQSVQPSPRASSPTEPTSCLGLRWTYHDLKDRVEGLAVSLRGLGCGPGMQLAAVLWNSAEWGLFFWVAAKLGMTFVPVDPRVPDDVRAMLSSLKPHVVVAQDADVAAMVGIWDENRLLIQCSGTPLEGWMSLKESSSLEISPETPSHLSKATNSKLHLVDDINRDDALIVFTSGTTGTPKGCVHTNQNLVSQTCDYDPNTDKSIIDRWLVHTPVSHIFAINNALRAWRCGDAVVFASKSFDIGATLQALTVEKCTIMSATPTLVKGILSHRDFRDAEDLKLELVTMGGTLISASDIRFCRQSLGAKAVVQAYGMSEGAPWVSWSRTDSQLLNGYHDGVGKVLPGVAIRICRVGTGEVLGRGEVGELHASGSSVISRYLGDADAAAFYDEDERRWLRTGDQAKMGEDGIVQILGRYKDIIIRGGENIYPAKVEAALASIPELQVQVIGVPDDVAGQVSVAVVRLPPGLSKDEAAKKIRNLNLRHALDKIYTLEELGLDKFPTTSIGKVKKEPLKEAVKKLHEDASQETVSELAHISSPMTLVDKLTNIWETISGTRPSKDEQLVHFADSIMLLRYCDVVLRSCGQRLYLQDLVKEDTLEKQAELLDIRRANEKILTNGNQRHLARHSGCRIEPPVAALRNSERPPYQQSDVWKHAQDTIGSLGFKESMLQGISTIRDSLYRTVLGQREHSYHVRMVFRVTQADSFQLRAGLERAIQTKPMMRTFLCHSDSIKPYHAIIEAGRPLYEQLIQEIDVENEAEAQELLQDDRPRSHSSPFMFKADIIRVRDTGQLYLSATYSHSIVDALFMLSWHFDLDQLILNPQAVMPPRTPYTMFSDLLSQYQDSIPAQNSVSLHVARLRGISRFKRALWPRQRAPGWMISNDSSSQHADERNRIRAEVWKGEWEISASEFRYPRLGRVVCLPRLGKLQEEHGVSPVIFARAALVIFNVIQTGSSHAVFSTWESGRSWPFVPQWIETMLPPAMDIDGPTAQWILHMFEVSADENIVAFLQHQRDDYQQMKNYEHAPWQKVVDGLRDEGDVAVDASFRQAFVWDVSLGLMASQDFRHNLSTLEPIARYDWADCGLFWNAFTVDKENLYFVASWDTAQMNDIEVEGYCDCLAEVMRKLADERHWNRTVGEVFGI